MRPEGAKEYVKRDSDLKSEQDLHKLQQGVHSWQWNVLTGVVDKYQREVEISLD